MGGGPPAAVNTDGGLNLQALLEEAVLTSARNRDKLFPSICDKEKQVSRDFRELFRHATEAQDAIIDGIKRELRQKVLDAASHGLLSVDVLEFGGSETYVHVPSDGGEARHFLWVFLVLGPRPHDAQEQNYARQFAYRPLLARLRDEFCHVFRVQHRHLRSANTNCVKLMW